MALSGDRVYVKGILFRSGDKYLLYNSGYLYRVQYPGQVKLKTEHKRVRNLMSHP